MVEDARCRACGAALTAGRCLRCEGQWKGRFIHRELVLLGALMAITLAGFVLTRSAAAGNRRMREHDAAEWFRRGEQALASGQASEAVTALRRASSKAPDDLNYSLALASALVADHHDTAAEQVLRRVREVQPEMPEPNLALARLEARRADVTAAIRDYQHALTSLWTADRVEERRRVRIELIHFLLEHDQHSRALSESLVLAVNLPDTPAAHLEAAHLFLAAGDPARALTHFQSVLSADPDNADALAGAGEASFHLGDYARARRYFRASPDSDHVRELQTLTTLVIEGDALAPRLPRGERIRRVTAAVEQARAALTACLATLPADAAARGPLQGMAEEAEATAAQLASRKKLQPDDIVEDGADLAYRIEVGVQSSCGVSAPADRAILLIGRRHGLDRQ